MSTQNVKRFTARNSREALKLGSQPGRTTL